MARAALAPGKKVKVNAGTRVHVWDFESCESDTWVIDGESAEHEFLVKSAPEEGAPDEKSSLLVLVQAGFDHEYEIRVHPSDVSGAPGLSDELLATIRTTWSSVRSRVRS
jgi:hypothetical protein